MPAIFPCAELPSGEGRWRVSIREGLRSVSRQPSAFAALRTDTILARLQRDNLRVFGVVPHYWALKAFGLFDDGATGAALVHAAIGVAWQAALLLLAQRFSRVVRR